MSGPGKRIRILLTGGGTGGHLFPGIAAAQALVARRPGSEVLFVGTRRKIDRSSLERYGFAVKSIHCQGLKGKGLVALVQALAMLPLSFVEAAVHILRVRPDVVLGVGGYVTGPVVAMAKVFGIPAVIHEQNSIPGLANRKLGRLVDKICLSIPQSARFFPVANAVLTGNPVRRDILDLACENQTESPTTIPTVVVLGGSQGAHRINELASEAFVRYRKSNGIEVRVIHQTGSADEQMIQARYRDAGVDAVVAAFFGDMAAVYRQADLLVSRAGATTLAEIATLGKPAILIPYPYAADNHQEMNAQHYVLGGGALMFVERDLTSELLADTVMKVLMNSKRKQAMAAAMRRLAYLRAAEDITDVCLELASRKTTRQ